MEKDEEKVDVAINVVRYQIMPSLVALQTMRNRLHLAFLGKKLMKWTALATGKELRRLSQEMAGLLMDYGQRFREAFILLARCRFHEPNLNVIILECVPAKAMLSIKVAARSIAGVKVISLGVIESGKDGYNLLGVGKGGELIRETKQAWYELLKIMVLICQFRVTFMLVDAAHRAATKKQNVLQRLIIPKIDLTMRYILSELEEQEREETFRLKRFKQLKYKYEVMEREVFEKEEVEEEVVEEEEVAMIEEPEPEPEPPEPTDEELIMKHIYEVIRLAEIIQNAALIPQDFGLTRCDLGKLRVQLGETVKLSQTSKDGRDCIKCKASSCNCPASANPAKPPCNEDLEVIRPPGYEAALKLLPKTKVETPVPDYIMRPRGRKPYRPGVKIDAVERLNDLQDHVDQVICLTHCYKQDGVLSKSAENFLKCLKNVKTKIDEIKDNRTVNAKIDRLKWELEHLEHVTDIVQKEGLSSDSISSFLSCCKEFKTKLEGRRSSKGAPSVCSIEKLLERIDVSIELSKEAKMGGLVSESVEEFIKTCKEIKAKIDSKEEEETTKPKVINDLRFNLHGIMKSISKYKQDGLLSDSIENFYTTCESTKAKLDSYKLPPGIKLDESEMTTLKQESRHSIIPKYEICPTCQGTDENALKSTSKTNKISLKEETKHPPVPVKSTSVPIFSRHGSQDKSYCPKCNKCCKCAKLQKPAPEELAEPEAPVDSSCGCGNATDNKRCKAKFYEDCPKCMKEPLIPSCKTTSTSSKSTEAVDNKDNKDNTQKTCKACSRVYTAFIHAKPGSYHSCKSNSSQPYVPKLNKPTSSQITAQQPLNHTCKSFQCIALDKTKSKEYDDNKNQEGGLNNNTVSMMILTEFKNIDGSSVKDSNSFTMKPGSCESVKNTKRVRNAPTTKGCIQIVRNIKSETLIRTQDLSDSYPPCLWSHTSAETLTSQDKNNESDSAQLDPFFCCNSSTTHNSGPVLPL